LVWPLTSILGIERYARIAPVRYFCQPNKSDQLDYFLLALITKKHPKVLFDAG